MKILVFDNYDSFTYNLVHMVEKITKQKVDVFRNDELPLEKVKEYDKIILSPGPGIPSEAGLLLPLIKEYAASKSILGVCLGHQAIGEAFGATLSNLSSPFHGIATPIQLVGNRKNANLNVNSLFDGMPLEFIVGRYHSWVVSDLNFPSELSITATEANGFIMALEHKKYDVQGVQFHPESVLTPTGETILKNWLKK
ncbi:MAG: aminodeoxychorismate/anthranilate synthase component II [Bacteroidota bacterium]|jgi:anthranilate synthase component II